MPVKEFVELYYDKGLRVRYFNSIVKDICEASKVESGRLTANAESERTC